MLNFLNTAILAAAAAAVLPFLLHLFSRRKVRVIPFSSIAYLKAMQKRQVRAIKIKQLLLLVIRTLIILAVVFAFARPATRGGYLGSHATVSAVLIVDNSASMGLSTRDGDLFDIAVKKAHAVLDMMGQSDEVAVMTTAGDFSHPAPDDVFGNPAAARQFLETIALTDQRADISQAVARATDLIAERPNLNHEIYLVSDFQKNALTPADAAPAFDGRLFLVDIPTEYAANGGVTDVDLGNQLIEVGTEFQLTATIKAYTAETAEDMLVSVYLDDSRIAQDDIVLSPGESGQVVFPLVVTRPGYHSGYVTLSDDELLADNRRFFSFYIPDRFNILLVGEDGLDTRLLRLALTPDETTRRHWAVTPVAYTRFAAARLDEYDVIILSNYARLPDGDVARIKDFVASGGGLLLNLGRNTDSSHYAAQFAEMTGITLGSGFPRQFSRTGFYLISDFDTEHPILSVFENTAAADLSFKSFARIKATLTGDETRLLARYSDGSPAAAISERGRGRVMYLGCDITPDISDISLHPFFVPFLVRSTEYLSSDFSTHAETILAGRSARRTLRHGFSVQNEFTLVLPDGSRRLVASEARDGAPMIDCGRLSRQGIYRIFNGATESDRFAVNIDAAEGDLYRDDWATLESDLHGSRLPYAVELAGFVTESRFGRELWQYFLAAALLLMALEMLVARDRGAALPGDE